MIPGGKRWSVVRGREGECSTLTFPYAPKQHAKKIMTPVVKTKAAFSWDPIEIALGSTISLIEGVVLTGFGTTFSSSKLSDRSEAWATWSSASTPVGDPLLFQV